jgi:hypothetical protein
MNAAICLRCGAPIANDHAALGFRACVACFDGEREPGAHEVVRLLLTKEDRNTQAALRRLEIRQATKTVLPLLTLAAIAAGGDDDPREPLSLGSRFPEPRPKESIDDILRRARSPRSRNDWRWDEPARAGREERK